MSDAEPINAEFVDVKYMPASERNRSTTRFAGPHNSFPIRPGHPKDVRNAWDLAGHAADPDAIRANIRRIARELGMAGSLPGTAKDDDEKPAGGKSFLDPADGTLVFSGGDVKALDDATGKVGGILVPFGTPATADVQGDYFTKDTKFNLEYLRGLPILKDHGFAKAFGPIPIGSVELSVRDDGIYVEGTLDVSRPAVRQIYDDVKASLYGWSSGSAERMVTRREVGQAREILTWPLLEATLSRTPVSKQTRAVALKALMAEDADAGLGYDDSYRDANAAGAALRSLACDLIDCLGRLMCDDDTPRAERDARIKAEFADFLQDGMAIVAALMDDDHDEDAAKAILGRHDTPASKGSVAGLTLVERSDRLVADCEEIAGLYRKAAEQRRADGRPLSGEKRDAIKAIVAGLNDLIQAADPKPDAARLLALRLRLARGQFEAAPAPF